MINVIFREILINIRPNFLHFTGPKHLRKLYLVKDFRLQDIQNTSFLIRPPYLVFSNQDSTCYWIKSPISMHKTPSSMARSQVYKCPDYPFSYLPPTLSSCPIYHPQSLVPLVDYLRLVKWLQTSKMSDVTKAVSCDENFVSPWSVRSFSWQASAVLILRSAVSKIDCQNLRFNDISHPQVPVLVYLLNIL